MASRTRERLISVARQLFVRQGLENTTMNDIATASDRGRRTIYTYFRTKSDIFQAVIEDESARIIANIEQMVAAAPDPVAKLRALMEYRIAVATDHPHGTEVWLKSLFSRDAKRAQRIRALVTGRIYELIAEISEQGVAQGIFNPVQTSRLRSMLTMMVRGSDWMAVREEERELFDVYRRDCMDFIIEALTAVEPSPDKPDINPNQSIN